MKNYVQEGDVLTLTAPYAVASGAGLQVGSIFGVATFAAANGASVEAATEGVFDLAKTGSQAWTQGAPIYWDNAGKLCTTTVGSNKLIGYAAQAQQAADTVGRVVVMGL
jgi:predicted RecA/RadA family phage recombinase